MSKAPLTRRYAATSPQRGEVEVEDESPAAVRLAEAVMEPVRPHHLKLRYAAGTVIEIDATDLNAAERLALALGEIDRVADHGLPWAITLYIGQRPVPLSRDRLPGFAAALSAFRAELVREAKRKTDRNYATPVELMADWVPRDGRADPDGRRQASEERIKP